MDGTFRAPDLWGTDSSAAFTDVTNGVSPVISQNTLWAPEGGLTPHAWDDFAIASARPEGTSEQELGNDSLGWMIQSF